MGDDREALPPLKVTWERGLEDYIIMVRSENLHLGLQCLQLISHNSKRTATRFEFKPLCHKCLNPLLVLGAQGVYKSHCTSCRIIQGPIRLGSTLTLELTEEGARLRGESALTFGVHSEEETEAAIEEWLRYGGLDVFRSGLYGQEFTEALKSALKEFLQARRSPSREDFYQPLSF